MGQGGEKKTGYDCFRLQKNFQFSAHCSWTRKRMVVLYADVRVGRLGGVCDGEENSPAALHLVASFTANSLPGTPEWAWI